MSDAEVFRYQPHLSMSNRSVLTALFFDSYTWMATALQKDKESGRTDQSGENNHHVLNIAIIGSGIAIELVYKALSLAEGGPIVKKHEIRKLHGAVPRAETRQAIEATLKEIGWSSVKSWIEFMDENVSHDTRRYWNHDPDDKRSGGINFTTGIAAMTIPGIAKVQVKLSDLTRRRIWQNWQSVPLIDIERESSRGLPPGPVYGSMKGPLLATLSLPAGPVEEGRRLGGIRISHDMSEVTVIPPESDEEWEQRKRHGNANAR